LDKFKPYVENLHYEGSSSQSEGELLLKSQRRTGFLGLIICITNLINLFDMSYINRYKLSQDHLGVFLVQCEVPYDTTIIQIQFSLKQHTNVF